MEILFADRLDDVSASIAAHLDRGGQPARAIPFLERAATVADTIVGGRGGDPLLQLCAGARSTSCRQVAIATSTSCALRSSLSVALNSGRGYAAPEVEQNLDRVFTLSRADGDGTCASALAVGRVHA